MVTLVPICVFQAEVRSLKERVDSTPMPVFAQNLIEEKNQEIDYLNDQLEKLQGELQSAGRAAPSDHDSEKIQSLVGDSKKNSLLEVT